MRSLIHGNVKKLKSAFKNLIESADEKLAKAEKTGDMKSVIKANAYRKSAKRKQHEVCIQKIF